jgi:hypothetical protein
MWSADINEYLKIALAFIFGVIVNLVFFLIGKAFHWDHDSTFIKPIYDISNVITPKVLLVSLLVVWIVGEFEILCRLEGYTIWTFIRDLSQYGFNIFF